MKKRAKLSISLVTFLGLVVLTGCNPIVSSDDSIPASEPPTSQASSEAQTPTELGKVKNLSVVHTDLEDWVVTFDSVDHASGYKVQVVKDDIDVIALTDIVSGDVITAQSADGTYTVKVKAIGDEVDYLDGQFATIDFVIENWVKHDKEGVLLSGRVENDVPYGEFSIEYGDGSVYVGTLFDDYLRKLGRLTYPNNMYYEGEFVNDNFEGEGFFSWSTTGDYKDANYYEGNFVGGNTIDQVGTFSWAARHNESIGGVMYWNGVQGPMGSGAKANEHGEGAFRFLGNSVYVGGLYFNGHDYLRVGFGVNLWTVSEGSAWITGGAEDKLIHGYVGEFDSLDHAWIYGKGVWYFNNSDGSPYGYVTGTWDGGGRIGNYADFNTNDLLEEFKTAIDLTPNL